MSDDLLSCVIGYTDRKESAMKIKELNIKPGDKVEVNIHNFGGKLKTIGTVTDYHTEDNKRHLLTLDNGTTIEMRNEERIRAKGNDSYKFGNIRIAVEGVEDYDQGDQEEIESTLPTETEYDEQSDMDVVDEDTM